MTFALRRTVGCIAFLATVLSPSQAWAEELRVWVAPGFYGWSESKCDPANQDALGGAATSIDTRLCGLLDPATSNVLATQFKQDMQTYFASRIQDKPGDHLPSSLSAAQKLRSTLAASLHVSRADIWQVSRNNGSSVVYLPITVSLLLTNISTGQVVFVETFSTIAPFTAEDRNIAALARQHMPEQLHNAITRLVQQAASHFAPYPVSATVRGSAGKSFVVDKGKGAGIRRGDLFSGDIRVIYADADFAIVQPLNPGERIKDGTIITKQNVQPAEYLSRHPAMVVMGATPQGMSPAYLKRTFESKLGTTKAFNIVYVNNSIDKIRRSAGAQAMSDAGSEEREVPEYFAYLESFALDPTEFPTNIPGRTLKTYEAYSIVYIVDRSGRVIYSRVARDRLTDETSGVSFAREQRQETVVLNSIDKLVSLIGAEFQPSSMRLPITLSGGEAIVNDPTGSLTNGVTGVVLRRAGQFSGIKGSVWSLVNDSRAEALEGRMVLSQLDPLDKQTANGDLFAIESGGDKPSHSRNVYGTCAAPANLPAGDLSAHPLLRSIGRSRFHQATRIPLYIEEMPNLLTPFLRTFRGQGAGLGVTQSRQVDFCLKTIFRFTHAGSVAASRGPSTEKYKIVMGYNIMNSGSQRVSGHGIGLDITTSPLGSSTSQSDIYNNMFRDFSQIMDKNAAGISVKIALP